MSMESVLKEIKEVTNMAKKYGMWNGIDKRFVFGINANSPTEAEREFKTKAGKESYKYRYSVKEIPEGFVNPKNPRRY